MPRVDSAALALRHDAHAITFSDDVTAPRARLEAWNEVGRAPDRRAVGFGAVYRGIDAAADVNGTLAWLLSAAFALPVAKAPEHPRDYVLPNRIGVLTMRSFSPAREEFQGVDDGH
jgi:hypothetical protein